MSTSTHGHNPDRLEATAQYRFRLDSCNASISNFAVGCSAMETTSLKNGREE